VLEHWIAEGCPRCPNEPERSGVMPSLPNEDVIR
jgi:hypothetical protein